MNEEPVSQLSPGEYDAALNGIRIHYTIRGAGPALLAISGGPGMDARNWDDFASIDDFVTVVLPEFVPAHWWEHFLHNQTALRLKAALLFQRNTVTIDVPTHLKG